MEKLYKVKEAGKALNVSAQLVYKLVKQGGIKTLRIGSAIRIPESALEEYLCRAYEQMQVD